MPDSIALLIDGDNISASHADKIHDIAATCGRVDIAHVYFNAQTNSGWHDVPAFRTFHSGTGKNATDVLLCVDAMEMALADGIGQFVIATSDGDFRHIAHRLRRLGRVVTGVGDHHCPDTFREACTAFECLDKPKKTVEEQTIEVVAALTKNCVAPGLSSVAKEMQTRFGITKADLPVNNWRKYVAGQDRIFKLGGAPHHQVALKQPRGKVLPLTSKAS
ncbi:NYN domain-containing protein [Sulfitobacter sp. D35]|uniref:NYN domain-containing protein n=1 Tax=Sulfitobacter sp. D35 TaxID=3083252 RepID=UPI00296E82A1|nr:NYN domain-containing protein [Sulfitobacter sp. D35]MDW4498801.1 NYN domain-containing protein [Sulfitobacter sp. D35]